MNQEKPTQSSLLYDGPQATANKNVRPRVSDSGYSFRFILITGISGLLCLITAVVLTIIGTIGLHNYGFANGPLIAGIVLFGLGGALSILACLAAGLK